MTSLLLMVVLSHVAAGEPKPGESLPEALGQWIGMVEQDDPKGAARTWAKDEKAAAQMRQHWSMIRRAHADHDYRKWSDGKGEGDATKVGAATTFKLGGHEFGHTHVDWEKTDDGWRVSAVWLCR